MRRRTARQILVSHVVQQAHPVVDAAVGDGTETLFAEPALAAGDDQPKISGRLSLRQSAHGAHEGRQVLARLDRADRQREDGGESVALADGAGDRQPRRREALVHPAIHHVDPLRLDTESLHEVQTRVLGDGQHTVSACQRPGTARVR